MYLTASLPAVVMCHLVICHLVICHLSECLVICQSFWIFWAQVRARFSLVASTAGEQSSRPGMQQVTRAPEHQTSKSVSQWSFVSGHLSFVICQSFWIFWAQVRARFSLVASTAGEQSSRPGMQQSTRAPEHQTSKSVSQWSFVSGHLSFVICHLSFVRVFGFSGLRFELVSRW